MIARIKYWLKRQVALKGIIKTIIAFMYFPVVLTAAVYAKFDRKIVKGSWLIGELGVDAKDNGFAFFKYLRTSHPDVKAVYYIDDRFPVSKEVHKIGQTVQTNSFKHMETFLTAKFILSTQDSYAIPWGPINWKQFKMLFGWLNPRAKFVFLQHGVIKDDATGNTSFNQTLFDYFVTTTPDEFNDINSRYGYPKGTVIKVGLPRYDLLFKGRKNTTRNQILFMPTWRYYLADISETDFINSNYFRSVNGVLSNQELNDFLINEGLKLIFYPPHREIQKFLTLFDSRASQVSLADVDEVNVSNLLLNSKLLISDFSSVAFDFAYLEKPIIYYQFDLKDYREGQYKQGYFSYDNDGFGPVAHTVDELVDTIETSVRRNFLVTPNYKANMNKAFPTHDANNSRRLYNVLTGENSLD